MLILYFTATGNSLAVAKAIAEKTGARLVDMGAAYRAGAFDVEVAQREEIGFVFPTHRWSTPPLVDTFVKRASFITPEGEPYRPSYCFTVETHGHFPGTESSFFAKMLEKYQNIKVDSAFSVKSVGNCLYLFDTPSDDVVARKLADADRMAERIANRVLARRVGFTVTPNPLGAALSLGTGHEGKNVRSRCTTCSPTNASAAGPAHRFVRRTRLRWWMACPYGKATSAQNALPACTVVPKAPRSTARSPKAASVT